MAGRETSAEIDAAAADWAVRVDHMALPADEQAALDEWLAGDTRRLGAYARARAMLAHARRAKALGPGFDPDAFIAGAPDEAEAEDFAEEPAEFRGGPRSSRRRFLWFAGSAAAAAGIGMVGVSWQAAARTYTTERGEIRLIPLEDGSSMTLNTASTARVTYGEGERLVELVEGEALFDVASDPRRPFVVAAGGTRVRAIGTSFSVTRLPGSPVQVTVRRGVVEVVRGSAASAPERLVANTQATTAGETAPIVRRALPPAEVDRLLAWRNGMLAFEDLPLSRAADQFARYSETRIRFADPAIAEETVTGLYAANDPAGFARAVATSLDLRLEPAADGVVLRR